MRVQKKLPFLALLLAALTWLPTTAFADDVDVQLPSTDGSDFFHVMDSDGEALMTVKSNGYVGIGVPDPGSPLHVSYSMKIGTPSISSPFLYLDNSAGGVNALGLYSASRDLYVGTGNTKLSLRTSGWPRLTIDSTGNVGIGTQTPAYKLDVFGDINVSGEIRRNNTAYAHPDYVFDPGYQLMKLGELREFVLREQQLPGMPSAEEVTEDGVRLFEQNRLVLEKLEEAYLYIFELQSRIEALEKTAEYRSGTGE